MHDSTHPIYMHCSYISGWKDISWLVGIMSAAACEYVLRYRGVSLFRTHRHVHCIYMCSEAVTAVYTVERYPGHQPTNLPRHQPSRTSPIWQTSSLSDGSLSCQMPPFSNVRLTHLMSGGTEHRKTLFSIYFVTCHMSYIKQLLSLSKSCSQMAK